MSRWAALVALALADVAIEDAVSPVLADIDAEAFVSELELERTVLALEATEEIGVSETDSEIEGLTDGAVEEGTEEDVVLDIDEMLVFMDCGPTRTVVSCHPSKQGRLCGLDGTSYIESPCRLGKPRTFRTHIAYLCQHFQSFLGA